MLVFVWAVLYSACYNSSMDKKHRPLIYAIECATNKLVYVGSTRQVAARWRDHKATLRAGTHHNRHLQHAWEKYGEEAFEFRVLEEVPDEELMDAELRWIREYMGRLFNVDIEPRATPARFMSEETRERMRASKRNLSPETRAKMSESAKRRGVLRKATDTAAEKARGKPRSEEVKRKISETRRKNLADGSSHYNPHRGPDGKFSELVVESD